MGRGIWLGKVELGVYVIVGVLGALASSASLALYFLYLVEAHQTGTKCLKSLF